MGIRRATQIILRCGSVFLEELPNQSVAVLIVYILDTITVTVLGLVLNIVFLSFYCQVRLLPRVSGSFVSR